MGNSQSNGRDKTYWKIAFDNVIHEVGTHNYLENRGLSPTKEKINTDTLQNWVEEQYLKNVHLLTRLVKTV